MFTAFNLSLSHPIKLNIRIPYEIIDTTTKNKVLAIY